MATSSLHGNNEVEDMDVDTQESSQDMYLAEADSRLCDNIQVDVLQADQMRPTNLWTLVQKALQTFFNKDEQMKGKNCTVESMEPIPNRDSASIKISPASEVDFFLGLKLSELKLKDMTVQVKFFRPLRGGQPQSSSPSIDQKNVPTQVRPVTDSGAAAFRDQGFATGIDKQDHTVKQKFTSAGSSEKAQNVQKQLISEGVINGQHVLANNPAGFGTGPDNPTPDPVMFDVPLFHYWHLSKAYSKEIEGIKKKFNVSIEPKVSVLITPAASSENRDLAEQALYAFTELVQNSVPNFTSVSLPKQNLKSRFMNEMLNEIDKEKARLQLNVSALDCKLTGPKESVDRFLRVSERHAGYEESPGNMVPHSHTYPRTPFGLEETPQYMSTKYVGATGPTVDAEEDDCPICLDTMKNKQKLPCSHEFCSECVRKSIQSMGSVCPVCKMVFGKVKGDQPDGTMKWHHTRGRLPGFSSYGIIEIYYSIPCGVQSACHPSPGRRFSGAERVAYLPDNREGNEVLHLLKRAFDQKLIFTVGVSRTTGAHDTVTWNDIHHKTSKFGGPSNFGYPDPEYLKRVKEELKAKGIE